MNSNYRVVCSAHSSGEGPSFETGVASDTDVAVETRTPAMYRVIILNDDFSPRDFVVHILVKFFKKTSEEATELMLAVHTQGRGLAGIYTRDIAETKSYQVNQYSKENKYPLKTIVEPEL